MLVLALFGFRTIETKVETSSEACTSESQAQAELLRPEAFNPKPKPSTLNP